MARIAFVQNLAYEYLGIMYLSSVLKEKNHAVEIFIEHGQGVKTLQREIEAFNPMIVGFPCTSGMHLWALQMARAIKKNTPGTFIILGGPHPTFFPEIIMEAAVDIICRGEGEGALLELAERVDKREDFTHIDNLWVKNDGEIIKNEVRFLVSDLDIIPFPDRCLYIKKYSFLNSSRKSFITGRGCPFDCTYCFNRAFKKIYNGKGSFLRRRSVDNVIDEMKEVKKRFGLKMISI